MRKTRKRLGFTLIELLVVMAIIGVLVAILLPAIQSARAAARRTQNRNNLKQIGVALHNYHDTFKMFPAGWIGIDSGAPDIEGSNGFGWGAMILPFIDQGPLFNQFDFKLMIDDPANEARRAYVPAFRSANDVGPNQWKIEDEGAPGSVLATLPTSNYVGNFGTGALEDCHTLPPGAQCIGDGVFYHNSKVRLADLLDGSSNTFIVGERRSDAELGWHSTWVGSIPNGDEHLARILGVADHTPNHPDAHFDDYSSHDANGVFFLFGDGHVQHINEHIDLTLFRSLATRDGGEIAGEF